MKSKHSALIIASAFLLLAALTPKAVMALDLIVEHNPTDPSHFSTIQSAIDFADGIVNTPTGTTVSYNVVVQPSDTPYNETVTLKSHISVRGVETARTILSSGTSGPVMTANGAVSLNVEHFTFLNSSTGIVATTNSNIIVRNNVFFVGTSGVGVQVSGAPSVEISNNTFFQNGKAIIRDSDTVRITNNIFSQNTVNISDTIAGLTQNNITYNDFNPTPLTTEPTGLNFIPNANFPAPDPLFVNIAGMDSHLTALSSTTISPCIDNGDPNITDTLDGTRSDIGAYGGADADTIPFIISGVTLSPATGSVTVSWQPNNSYVVTNPTSTLQGGYNVYYSLNRPGAPYDNKVSLSSANTSTTISGLITSATPPDAPILSFTGFKNEELDFSWTSVLGATSYNLYYTDNDATTPVEQVVNGITDTSFQLQGLVNGHRYTVQVTAVSQPTYYFSVTAFDYTVAGLQGGTPGSAHESSYQSPDKSITTGTGAESLRSNAITGDDVFPETLVPYPNLPNSHQGCFIATAAYGYYSAPQVQALRTFRDQYLLTNGPGRAFVRWYYTYGPDAAAWLTVHPGFKPLVRAALLPAVGLALFMTETSLAPKLGFLMMIAACLVAYAFYRRRFSGPGGSR
ncbi:MAG: CFI-box-CTERM domain-containing protein [Betaproteobacteria bacterium]